MDIIRTIHPVGQGGFYTETLKSGSDEHIVVYDCGGSSISSMESYLKKFLHESSPGHRMKIDAVFISHLHADHVNGLEYLLKNADVRYLILPQLTEEMKIEALVYNCIHSVRGEDRTDYLIPDLYNENGRYRDTKIIQVSFAEPGERINVEEEGVDLSENLGISFVGSGRSFHFGSQTTWVYIPYNPLVKNVTYSDFIRRMNPFIGPSIEDSSRLIRGHVRDCKKIYEDCFKNQNEYSMTLYSGLKNPQSNFGLKRFCCHYCDCFESRYYHYDSPNCLYTGDFEPDEYIVDLKQFYNMLWGEIRSIQVPHHGSRKNYHPDLYEYAIRGFVSVGERNRYHHPSIDTLIKIHDNGCMPVIVTDSLSTIRIFQYGV